MPDTDILVSELNSASQINTTDLLLMTQPDGDAQTGYSSRKGTVLQVANKLLKDTEYTTDLPNFDNKSVFGALNEIHNGTYLYKENETPYSLRQTPITANRCLEKLVGCSCAFNQLATNGATSPIISNDVTATKNADNSWDISGTASDNVILNLDGGGWRLGDNHVYLISGSFSGGSPSTFAFGVGGLALDFGGGRIWKNSNHYTTAFAAFVVGSGVYVNLTNVFFRIHDLTACFGSEVADYLYTLESGTAGSGISLFRQLFPLDYYAYQTATLISSKPVSKVIKDSNDQTIATYPLGGDELRGLLKVENGNLVAFGDIKPSDGNGTEVFTEYTFDGTESWNLFGTDFWYCAFSGVSNSTKILSGNGIKITPVNDSIRVYIDENPSISTSTDMNTVFSSGVKLIYEKATPTAKSYTPFSNPMISGSTEEFTDTRSVKMPCGHDSLYYTSNFKYW